MQQLLQNIHFTVRRLAKPNPKQYPDVTVMQYNWNKNIRSIYIAMIFLIYTGIFMLISNYSLGLKLTYMLTNIWVLTSLIVLCRSYIWIYNIIFVIVSSVYGLESLNYIPEAPYAYLGYIYLILICVLLYSGSIKLSIVTGVIHVLMVMTKFRERMIILVNQEDPEVFADQLVRMSVCFFILKVFTTMTLVRTLDKQTMELLRYKCALENALEQQKTFIFSFSHELRNPINSLLGNLQLVLQGETLSPKAAEMIEIAKVCGEILLHNINNVLDTGKYDIGKLEVNPVSTQVHELFQRTWSIYNELLKRKRLKGQLKIEKSLPARMKMDSQKVTQVLLNLIGNSIKFTEKGSVSVTVKWLRYSEINEKCFDPIPYDETEEGLFEKEDNLSTVNTGSISELEPAFGTERRTNNGELVYPREESKGVLKIIVRDTGCGMKKEALNKLFQKFSQVSDNICQRQIGTGLGLFITKEICNAMKGEIRAYSKSGLGSTFVVCLPTTSLPFDDAQRIDPRVVLSQLREKNIKALVADDSPFNVNLICNYFSQFGGTVVSAVYNGYEAFQKYKECKATGIDLDAIILDIDMPVMDGRTACDRIRRYERENNFKPVAIILISGNYDREQIYEYINPDRGNKANCFLSKPVSFCEFNRALYNLVTY